MIKFFVVLLFLINSCSYPDIDTVPDFSNMHITIQESIELCKLSISDNEQKSICYQELNQIINRL